MREYTREEKIRRFKKYRRKLQKRMLRFIKKRRKLERASKNGDN